MNRFVIVSLASLLFLGCYYSFCPRCEDDGFEYYENQVPNSVFQKLSFKYYWEFGIAKIVGTGLYVKNDGQNKKIEAAIKHEMFCRSYVNRGEKFISERIYLDSLGEQTFECIFSIKQYFEVQRPSLLSRSYTLRLENMNVSVSDSSYVFLYRGDSLQISSPELLSYNSIKDSVYLYKFELKKNPIVMSYSAEKTSSQFEGYKPLKLDPSILPLESPGYKKLREYEESLAKRK